MMLLLKVSQEAIVMLIMVHLTCAKAPMQTSQLKNI